MKKLIVSDLKEHILFATGLYKLDGCFLPFLLTHFGFVLVSNLQTVFVNTLLLRLTGNSDTSLIYNMVLYFCSATFFLVGYKVMKSRAPVITIRFGLALYVLMYAVFFCVFSRLAEFMVLIAILHGVANAFYWTAYIILLGQYTADRNRDLALCFTGLANGVAVLVMPAVAGSVISLFRDLTGYIIMFGAAAAIATLTLLYSRRMQYVPPLGGTTHYREVMQLYLTRKTFRCIGAGEFIKCFRDGIMTFYLNVLLFQIVENEALVGLNTFLTGAAAILASYVYGRVVNAQRRVPSMYLATTTLVLTTLTLFLRLDAFTIILFGVANSFLNLFIINPSATIVYQLTNEVKSFQALRGDFYGVKEQFVGFGRLVGIFFVLCMPRTVFGSVVVLTVLALSQYLMVYLEHIAYKEIQRMEQE